MDVTVTVPGEGERTVTIEEGTYADLLQQVGFSPQEASVLVDGRPVPTDRPIEATEVTVLRLVAGGCAMAGYTIRRATISDAIQISDLFDRTLVSHDRDAIRRQIRAGAVFTAVSDDRLLGAVIISRNHLSAIAVIPSHRNGGIGRALVRRVQDQFPRVTAACHPQVAGFYEALGFSLYTLPNGRIFAVLSP